MSRGFVSLTCGFLVLHDEDCALTPSLLFTRDGDRIVARARCRCNRVELVCVEQPARDGVRYHFPPLTEPDAGT